MSFTKIKDVDLEILSKMDDRELGRICSTDKYFANLCKNDMFWKNRTMRRFSKYFGNELGNYFSKSGLKTWREYYISIVDFLEKLYNREYAYSKREDLRLLKEKVAKNGQILQKEVGKYDQTQSRWKELIKSELINPNYAFDLYYLYPGNVEDFIKELLSIKDERIKLDLVLNNYSKDEDEDNEEKRETRKKLVKIILQDNRVTIKGVVASIQNLLDNRNYNGISDYLLDEYLDYIITHGAAEQLRNGIDVKSYREDLLQHIYEKISPHISSNFPHVLQILNNRQFSKLEYDKILDFIKNL